MDENMEMLMEDTTMKVRCYVQQEFAAFFSLFSQNVTWGSCSLLLPCYLSSDINMKSKYLQEVLEEKSNFVQ